MTDFSPALPPAFHQTIHREWTLMGSPGTWWTGAQRIAIAQEVRYARLQRSSAAADLPAAATEAIRTIAIAARTVDHGRITAWQEEGLEPLPLVELLAITTRTCAIDTCLQGFGLDPLPLPEPEAGDPSAITVEGAELNHGWLPTKGPAGAPNCFSAVEMEHRSLQALHSTLYLGLPEMRDMGLLKDLHRSQIELLAARTSYLNDCFY